MTQENTTIQTPLGKNLTLKSFITIREKKIVQEKMREKKLLSITPSTNPDSITSEQQEFMEKIPLETCVVDYDGSKENVYERLLDLPSQEFDFIQKACAEVLNPKETAK